MSIDPSLITTVQVSDLPPNALAPENVFPHQVGDVLSKATIQQLIDYVRAQSISQPYEIKYLYPPNPEYITDNFDMAPGATQGLGRVDGLWNGWAIFNGNNGTVNLDGQTLIGYGANYATIGQFVGEEEHILTISEMPSHNHLGWGFGGSGSGSDGLATNTFKWEKNSLSDNTGGGQAHNNMQPSMVVLIIYKLP